MEIVMQNEPDDGSLEEVQMSMAFPEQIPLPVQLSFNYVAMMNAVRYRVIPDMGGGASLQSVELDVLAEKAYGVACQTLGRYMASWGAESEEDRQARLKAQFEERTPKSE